MKKEDFSPEFRALCEASYFANDILENCLRVGLDGLPSVIEILATGLLKQDNIIQQLKDKINPY